MNKMESMESRVKKKVAKFLLEIAAKDKIEFQAPKKGEPLHLRWRIYTNDHVYAIAASFDRDKLEDNYLGCIASSRKPIAGETWTRGNDLPDGKLRIETWNSIKNRIIEYELVRVTDPKGVKYELVCVSNA